MKHELSKERLEEIAAWREKYGAGHNVMLTAEEAEALARFALAAHEQEPVSFDALRNAVAEMTGCRPMEWMNGDSKGHQVVPFINFNSLSRIVEKFRTHPAPSIPAAVPWQEPIGAFHISGGTVEATTDYCKDGEWPVQDGIVEVYAWPAPTNVVPDKWPQKLNWSHHDDMTQGEVLAWNNAVEACRAAMLQSEPVSQPYKLPEKVSELISGIRTINRSPQHVARVMGDTAPCYWQRKEWIDWILSLCDEVEQGAKP